MGDQERRPHDRDHEPAPDEQQRPQDDLERTTRASGGDAEAAGSLEEREAVARDDEDLVDRDGGEDEDGDGEEDGDQDRSAGEHG